MKIIAAEVFVTSPTRNFVTLRITTGLSDKRCVGPAGFH